jgi:hypothetical protein
MKIRGGALLKDVLQNTHEVTSPEHANVLIYILHFKFISGISSYVYAVNRLPKTENAKCYPSPASGMAVRDKFNIQCDGEFEDEDLPLTYKIAYKLRPTDGNIWVYAGEI